jgi:hypothetical protein
MHDCYDSPQRKKKEEDSLKILGWSVKGTLVLSIILIIIAVFLNSCDAISGVGKGSVVYFLVDNTRNCTDAVIEDPRSGEILGVVPAGQVKQLKVTAPIFNQQDRTLIFAHTPYHIRDRILAGDISVIPKGCDDWGTDTDRIRLRDGYHTEVFKVRLRPPDYWEERANRAGYPPAVREQIQEEIKATQANKPEFQVNLK